MKIIRHATPAWTRYLSDLRRNAAARPAVEEAVARIVTAVRRGGDGALLRLTRRFDGVRLKPAAIRVRPDEIRALARVADPRLVAALGRMARQIRAYHERQVERGFRLRLADGSVLEEVVRPLDAVGSTSQVAPEPTRRPF